MRRGGRVLAYLLLVGTTAEVLVGHVGARTVVLFLVSTAAYVWRAPFTRRRAFVAPPRAHQSNGAIINKR